MTMGRKKFSYKGVSVNILGLPTLKSNYEKKKNLSKRKYLRSFISNFKKDAPRNLLLMYDIPHTRKKERDWFRRQLKNFNFIMIQKSVWVGPSPLPPEFLAYIKRINLEKEFKTFKLAKSFSSSSSSL